MHVFHYYSYHYYNMAIMNNPKYVSLSPVEVTKRIHKIQDTLSEHRGQILLCSTHIATLREGVKSLDERSCENAINIMSLHTKRLI